MRGAVVPRFAGSRCGRASEGHLTKRHRCNERRCKPACMPPPTATPQPPPTPSHSHPTATPQPPHSQHPSHTPATCPTATPRPTATVPHEHHTNVRRLADGAWLPIVAVAQCAVARPTTPMPSRQCPPPRPRSLRPALCAASVLCCGARSERTGERCAPLVCLTHTAKGQVGTEPALHTRARAVSRVDQPGQQRAGGLQV